MNERVLIVDDDVNLLQGLRRQLRKKFDLKFVEGGLAAKELIDTGEEFAVIVSDMQMPDCTGLELLCYAKNTCPDTTRIMLTGNADQKTATDAVNEGSIFRFVNKPCDTEDLENVIRDGLRHYRLVTAEKEVLEQTLNGSIELMTDVLALLNPRAFGRANRIRSIVKSVCKSLGIVDAWQLETAATFAQVGRATIPTEVLEMANTDEDLSAEQQTMLDENPAIAAQMVSRIPRLESVGEIIARQSNLESDPLTEESCHSTQGLAEILNMILTYDNYLNRFLPQDAVNKVSQLERFSKRLSWIKALREAVAENHEVSELYIEDLMPGMILDENVYDACDILIVTKDQEVTESLITRLKNFKKAVRKITEPIRIRNEVRIDPVSSGS